MATSQEVINPQTITNYGRGSWDNVTDSRPALGILDQKGMINGEEGGTDLEWVVTAGHHKAYTIGDGEDHSDKYSPTKRKVRARLDWGRKGAFDYVSKFALQQNRGDQALEQFAKENVPAMWDALFSQGPEGDTAGIGSLNYEFLNRDDSAYTGEGLPMGGLPSIFRFDSGLANTEKEAAIAAGATYAGLSLEQSGLAGLVDNEDPYAWTPRGVNVNYDWDGAGADSGLTTGNFDDIFAYAQNSVVKGTDKRLTPDCVIMDRNHFDVGRSFISNKQQVYIDKPNDGALKWGLGTNSFNFYHNGMMFYWDDQMPIDTSYVLNFDQLGLHYLNKLGDIAGDKYPGQTGSGGAKTASFAQRAVDVEVDYDKGKIGVAVSLILAAQFKLNPRFQCKVGSFA
jgi:hypothetical protein